jgi:c-di-GMP-binding flagellar brake protein YcgR
MTTPSTDSLGHVLRSHTQIDRVLGALATKGEMVTAELAEDLGSFTSRFIAVDPGGQFITIALAADKSVNAALLALARVTFVCAPGNWHIEFVAVGPREVVHEGAPAISLGYPEVLTVQQRREHLRALVPSTVPLRCIADADGFAPFDAQIDDISVGGISILLYAPEIRLEPGTVLVGCRIDVPGAEPIITDLEVRYSEAVTLPDGRPGRCSGFRFVNAQEQLKYLVDELDKG